MVWSCWACFGLRVSLVCKINQQALGVCLTNCADDASVARHGRFRVDVKQAHVLNEGISHGSMQLLGVDDGRTRVLWLRHDWICVGRKDPVETERGKKRGDWIVPDDTDIHDRINGGLPHIITVSSSCKRSCIEAANLHIYIHFRGEQKQIINQQEFLTTIYLKREMHTHYKVWPLSGFILRL